jgi:hypothetical protein
MTLYNEVQWWYVATRKNILECLSTSGIDQKNFQNLHVTFGKESIVAERNEAREFQ